MSISVQVSEPALKLALGALADLARKRSEGEASYVSLSEAARKLVDESVGHVRVGELDQAIALLNQAIKLEPKYNRALLQLVNIYKKKDFDHVAVFFWRSAV